jgi:hypothetical protein
MPLVYAAAIYGFFLWHDKRASGAAKKAFSEWLRSRYENEQVVSALLELFSRLYGQKLLSWSTLLRTACISLVLSLSYLIHLYSFRRTYLALSISSLSIPMLGMLLTNVISDYLSLFVVRWSLRKASNAFLWALIVGPAVGAALILIVYTVGHYLMMLMAVANNVGWQALLDPVFYVTGARKFFERYALLWGSEQSLFRIFVIPAIAVHIWLPLLALGVLGMQFMNSFLWAAGKMQWFLKRGQHHPFQAIGYVAAGIVFIGGSVAHVVWGWLHG